MRVLGIDPGTVRIGLALSDPTGVIAQPLSVLTRRSPAEDMAALGKLIADHEVERVVIGLPRMMDGRLDAAAAAAKEFGSELARVTSRPVEYWDERLTTVAAERYLVAQGKRRRQRRADVDRMAAALLLQSYLDSRGNRGSGG